MELVWKFVAACLVAVIVKYVWCLIQWWQEVQRIRRAAAKGPGPAPHWLWGSLAEVRKFNRAAFFHEVYVLCDTSGVYRSSRRGGGLFLSGLQFWGFLTERLIY